MSVTAYRIVKPIHAGNAFDGEGARRYGGRWNNKGTPVVYLAGSLALAALELLVHLESEQILSDYVSIGVAFDSEQMILLPKNQYPEDWRDYPAPASTRAIGDSWFRSKDSLILKIQSAIIPGEYNFLLNPLHRDFAKLSIGQPRSFSCDDRLIK